jgi:hypothetical protein
MKNKDIHKEARDSMDSTLENKFMTNLQWSMLFFCFDNMAEIINEENEFKKKHVQKQFIKNWKDFAHNSITKSATFYKFDNYYEYLQAKIINPSAEETKNQTEESVNENQVGGDNSIYEILSNKLIETIKAPNSIDEIVLENLYSKFIAKSNEIVKDGGLIMFLTPPSIFSPKNKNKDILLDSKNNLKLVRLFNENPFPNVSTNVCYFMMEKSQKGETKVVDDNCSVTLNITHDFIFPSTFNEITVSIFNKVFNSPFEKFKFERDCKLHTQKKEIFSNDESEIFCYPVYCGSKIKFTSVLPNNIYLNKIVVSRSGYYKPIIDYGTNGTSESNFYIISNDVLLNFNILNHPIYKFIVKNTKFNGFIHQDILKSLPNPNTDDDLFGVFGLTNEEQKYIVNDVR